MEEIREMFEKLGVDYSLWIHGIDKGDLENRENIARSIMETGLNIPGNYPSILSTAVAAGRLGYDAFQTDIENYQIDNGERCNVVVAAPIFIENSTGERIYLGSPDRNMNNKAQTREPQIVLDEICGRLGKVPPEFIYGYYDEKTGQVTPNERHYTQISLEERDSLFDRLKEALDRTIVAKDVSDKILAGDKSALEVQTEFARSKGLRVHGMVETALKKFEEHRAILTGEMEVRASAEIWGVTPLPEIEEVTPEMLQNQRTEALINKVMTFKESVPMSGGFFGSSVDESALAENRSSIEESLSQFSLEDVRGISMTSVPMIKQGLKVIEKLPDDAKPDRIIEGDLEQLMQQMKLANNGVDRARIICKRNDCI